MFTIPNTADAAFPAQAGPDTVDIEVLIAGLSGVGVVTGCAVTAQGAPDGTVAVAAGTIAVAGDYPDVASSTVNVLTGAGSTAAHATLPRFDLIVANSSGALSVVVGTAAADPAFPPMPASSVLLAALYVPATDTDIDGNQITDKRVPVAREDFSGVKLTKLFNLSIANSTAFPFDTAEVDSDGWWDIGIPTKLVVPAGRAGWYWVGAAITTLGTTYGGGSNLNVQIQIAKNWDGMVGTLLDATIVYERFDNSNGSSAHGNSTMGLVYLDDGDELELTLVGTGTLLVESNPSDGLPSGYLTDAGPGTLSPHFFAVAAKGAKGDAGAAGDFGWAGPWDSGTTYDPNDVVEDLGSSYVAVATNTNDEPPSAAWDLVAAKGDDGAPGTTPSGGMYLADWAKAVRTAGNVTLNQTAITEVDAGLQLTLTGASAGDLVIFGVSGRVSNVAQYVGFDVYTMPGGVRTNPFGSGLSASLASLSGIQAWSQTNVAQEETIAGTYPYELVSGDISGGNVVVSLFYAKLTATARTLYAVANNPLAVFAFLYKPF